MCKAAFILFLPCNLIMNITNCVFGILVRDRKILLVKNLYKEFGPIWGIPGGKQDFNETFQTALIRECKEEVNLSIQVGAFITIFERIQPLRPFHLVAPVFEIFSDSSPFISKNDHVTDFHFFSADEIANNHETIMNRKELLLYLNNPKALPSITQLSLNLDDGPIKR